MLMRAKLVLLLAGVSLSTIGLSAADAQSAPPASDTGAVAATDGGIADIVVTGEKHETSLQTAPLAITVVSGDALRERNVNELADLNGYVPGLTITKSEGAERIIAIRGIGYETAQNPNSEPGVAFHIDGVYIAHVIALNQDLLDVDHIEVLRGPQGTVFGQTSTGGAINVITRKPVLGETSGQAQLSYGNYNYKKGYGSINLPFGETIALRAAIQYFGHDGYAYATQVPGNSHYALDDANNVGSHAALLWKPNDSFTAELAGQTFDADHHAFAQKCLLCQDFDNGTDISSGSINYLTDPYANPRKLYQDYPGKFRTRDRLIYLTLSQALGDVATIKSVSAYQFLNKHQSGDNDRFAYQTYFDNLVFWHDKSKTFTEEVSLQSTKNDSVEWTAGAFYLHQKALQNILELSSAGFLPNPGDPTGPLVSFQTDSPYKHVSYAGYGQATVHATDTLNLIAGVRYSHDRVTAAPVQYFGFFGVTTKKVTSDAFTGKLSAEYQFTPDNMIYATGSKGYKPAGLNFNANPVLVGGSLKKERVYAAEIGSKNVFFEKRLQLNASAYYYWYKDFQFTAEDPVPNQGGTTNIPKANIYGLEIEATAIPIPPLRFDGNISLGRGKFKGSYLAIDEQTANYYRALANSQGSFYTFGGDPASDARYFSIIERGLQNTDGNRVPKLPGVQGGGSATYTADLGGAGEIVLRGEVLYRGHFNSRIFNDGPFDRVPSYTLLNLYIQYRPRSSPFTFSISAENVTDKAGISNKFADPYGSATTSVEYINPRQVFGTVAYKF